MTLEQIFGVARREVVLPETHAMQRLLFLLADDSARLMRRAERPTGSGVERRQAAHTVPIEDCHRILLRSLRLVADLHVQPSVVLDVFADWKAIRTAESMVPTRAHRFRQAVEGAIIAKIDFENDPEQGTDAVKESALDVFRAAVHLAAVAQGLTPERFDEQLAASATA